MNEIRLLVVDDHKMVREGLRSVLEDEENFRIVNEASNGIEAMKMLEKADVDVVLTDISMPKMDGIELMKEIKKAYPEQKVIALTMLGEAQHIKQMLQAGAAGYLLKNCGSRELKRAIHAVNNGENYYSPEVQEVVMDYLSGMKKSRMSIDLPLTDREKEILHLIMKEYSNQEIAEKLFISQRTVDAHKRNLLAKTGTKNIAGLVLWALEKRLFDDA